MAVAFKRTAASLAASGRIAKMRAEIASIRKTTAAVRSARIGLNRLTKAAKSARAAGSKAPSPSAVKKALSSAKRLAAPKQKRPVSLRVAAKRINTGKKNAGGGGG